MGAAQPLSPRFFFIHLVTAAAALVCAGVFLTGASRGSVLSRGSFLLTLLFLALICLAAVPPIIARDALIHHLAVPKFWLSSGRIAPVSWHEWSYYPMLIDLAYAGLMSWGLDRLTPYYHLLYLVLLAALGAWCVLRRTGDQGIASLAALFTVSMPINISLASTPLVDLPLALFMGIALVLTVEFSGAATDALLIGIALGLALSTKYNALLAVFLFFLLFPLFAQTSGLRLARQIKPVLLIGAAAFAVFLPWLLKNYVWIGNPLYPLMGKFFGTLAPAARGVYIPNPMQHRLLLYNESYFDLLLIPLRMLFSGQDGNPQRFDGQLSPLLILGILPLLRSKQQPWLRLCFGYVVTYMAFALFLSSARIRYLSPVFVPAVVLAVCGAAFLADKFKGHWRQIALAALALIQAVLALHYTAHLFSDRQVSAFLSRRYDREQYLTMHIPEYPLIRYVNEKLPADANVYLIFTGNRFYYFDRQVRSSGHHSANELVRWLQSSSDASALAKLLAQEKIGYLLVQSEAMRNDVKALLNEREIGVWNDFQRDHLRLLSNAGLFSLWRIE